MSITGTAAASRALRSQPPERSSSSRSATSGSPAQRSTSGWRGESSTKRASPTSPACGVKTTRPPPSGSGEVQLDPVAAAEDVALGLQRELVPVRLQAGEVAVVLLQVGGEAQEPGRAADQPHLVVAAPAAPVLDLQRRQRRLAGVAPVDRGVVAVDQPRLVQGEEEPLRPAVLGLVGAVEGALVVEGEAEPLHLPEHPLAAALDPLGRPGAALDRRHLGRQSEGVEAEAEEHRVAAGAAEARVGVADRVVAHVAHVQVARGERAGGLDVDGLLPGGRRGRGESGRSPPTPPGAPARARPDRNSASGCSSRVAVCQVTLTAGHRGPMLGIQWSSHLNYSSDTRNRHKTWPRRCLRHPGARPRPEEEVPTWERVRERPCWMTAV